MSGIVLDGIRRAAKAPVVLLCVYLVTLAATVPFTAVLRSSIAAHLGHSLAAEQAAQTLNYQWLLEYQGGASGLGKTLTTSVIGFAAVLDNLSAIADAESRPSAILWLGAAYLLLWLFLAGGIVDRYARNRPTRSHEFFTACGVYFVRFLRLAPSIAITYYALFAYVHPLIFDDLYGQLTYGLTADRTAFFYRLALYLLFGSMLAFVSIIFDYAKVRAVVEDRRSMVGAIVSSVRFVRRNAGAVLFVYLANGLFFLVVLVIYAVLAPGVGGTPLRIWTGFAVGQLYVIGRLAIRLVTFASETALFQTRLAHAGYVASAAVRVPEPPVVEQVVG